LPLLLLVEVLKRELLVDNRGRRCQARRTSAVREEEKTKEEGLSSGEGGKGERCASSENKSVPCEPKMKKTATPMASTLKSPARAVKLPSVTMAQLKIGEGGSQGRGSESETRRSDLELFEKKEDERANSHQSKDHAKPEESQSEDKRQAGSTKRERGSGRGLTRGRSLSERPEVEELAAEDDCDGDF